MISFNCHSFRLGRKGRVSAVRRQAANCSSTTAWLKHLDPTFLHRWTNFLEIDTLPFLPLSLRTAWVSFKLSPWRLLDKSLTLAWWALDHQQCAVLTFGSDSIGFPFIRSEAPRAPSLKVAVLHLEQNLKEQGQTTSRFDFFVCLGVTIGDYYWDAFTKNLESWGLLIIFALFF